MPGPIPTRSMTKRSGNVERVLTAATKAAPVGVTSSPRTPEGRSGMLHRAAMLTTAGTGTGMTPCWQRTVPDPSAQIGDDDAIDAKGVKRCRCGHHVGYGVNGAHFMKMNVRDIDAMSLRLCVSQDIEHAMGDGARALAHVRRIDERGYIGRAAMAVVVTMGMIVVATTNAAPAVIMDVAVAVLAVVFAIMFARMAVHVIARTVLIESAIAPMKIRHVVVAVLMSLIKHDVEIAQVEPRFHHAADANLKAFDAEAVERAKHRPLIRPGVEERGHRHVAAYPRRAFQMQNTTRRHLAPPRWLMRLAW